ncbi:translation elongation factor Ts [Candidatus Uhrbacteria bacterium CG_4_9_14_3_um_filter_50_9]|uniref:Elongation factor Ts n=1 Tax=Candidatus Uhrbacteria bacterium CG_4_9_14_3_um_filter_50_9 TaxID=1975035 RepID=A0A2M7XDL1_9BACT|nr:MAG: translation elongation factor Ts [Candidatus Uhrbacteria bacterium CG_4_9_14_3_um_filter_50_9]
MGIDAKMVAELRAQTGAGMMNAKQALEESGGDLTKAAEILREKGIAKAAKKADRETNEGRVHAYIHSNGKLGAMVEVLCETDFVARNEAFIAFCHDLAMHVSATEPLYLTREDVPEEVLSKEKEMFLKEMEGESKPADVLEKIIEGKLNKWFSEVVLMEQRYVKDEDQTIEEFVKSKISSLGENMQVRGFKRFSI